MKNKTQYNKFYKDYAEKTEALEEESRRKLYENLPNLSGKRLLDVGCGSGHDAEYYRSQGAKVWGIDVSEKEIGLARGRVDGSFEVGEMESLPYENESFDVVTSNYALQSSENVQKSLLEMIRVTKSGGLIVILTKHPVRNLLEGHINDGRSDYFNQGIVTSHIFNRTIELKEPGHTMMEYFNPEVLSQARLESLKEICDYPNSDQVIENLKYPTCMILMFIKN